MSLKLLSLSARPQLVGVALGSAILPLVSYLGPASAGLITGSLVVEKIFNLPGLGKFFVISALQRDYTVVMGMVIFYAALILALSPGLSPTQVRSQIERTATHLGSSTFDPQFGWGLVNAAAALGALVPNNYGQVQITVQDVSMAPVGGADVVLWVGTASCLGLTQEVQTAQTSSGSSPAFLPVGVAPFNAVPVGSYCATASTMTQKGATTAPFAVTAGTLTTATVTILP